MECSLYVHVPFCASKCDYCDFYSIRTTLSQGKISSELQNNFLNSLEIQLSSLVKRFNVKTWRSIYIGGGTPSLLSNSTIVKIVKIAMNNAKILPLAEITIECNPEDVDINFFEGCYNAGINRISCGIQTLEQESLVNVHRRTTVEANRRFLKLVSQNWDKQWSFDLITGLPNSTLKGFTDGLQEILSYSPKHCSLYELTIEDETPLGKKLLNVGTHENKRLTQQIADSSFEQWESGKTILEKAGLLRYEVSNFATSGHESQHNLVYWKSLSWLGVGAGSSGTIQQRDSKKESLRITTNNNVEDWLKSPISCQLEEKISFVSSIKEYLMMGFRLTSGILKKDFFSRYKINLDDVVFSTFNPVFDDFFSTKKLIVTNDSQGKMYLSDEGLNFLNAFLKSVFESVDSNVVNNNV